MLLNMEDFHLLENHLNLIDNFDRAKQSLENDEKIKNSDD